MQRKFFVELLVTLGIVARVIFAETANCTYAERELVASVIWNRVGHPGFGSPKTVQDVVANGKQFKCIDDPDNKNWSLYEAMDMGKVKRSVAWWHSQQIVQGQDKFTRNSNVLFYHDKSISMPEAWKENKFYTITKEIETKHFVFYRAEKKG